MLELQLNNLAEMEAAASAQQPQGITDESFEEIPTVTAADVGLDGQQCAICMGDFEPDEELKMLPCSELHAFHTACIRQWLSKGTSCPLCRNACGEPRAPPPRPGITAGGPDGPLPLDTLFTGLSQHALIAQLPGSDHAFLLIDSSADGRGGSGGMLIGQTASGRPFGGLGGGLGGGSALMTIHGGRDGGDGRLGLLGAGPRGAVGGEQQFITIVNGDEEVVDEDEDEMTRIRRWRAQDEELARAARELREQPPPPSALDQLLLGASGLFGGVARDVESMNRATAMRDAEHRLIQELMRDGPSLVPAHWGAPEPYDELVPSAAAEPPQDWQDPQAILHAMSGAWGGGHGGGAAAAGSAAPAEAAPPAAAVAPRPTNPSRQSRRRMPSRVARHSSPASAPRREPRAASATAAASPPRSPTRGAATAASSPRTIVSGRTAHGPNVSSAADGAHPPGTPGSAVELTPLRSTPASAAGSTTATPPNRRASGRSLRGLLPSMSRGSSTAASATRGASARGVASRRAAGTTGSVASAASVPGASGSGRRLRSARAGGAGSDDAGSVSC